MVYGRDVGEQELNFEASGALMRASLVMRDRETDSWWSIMTSNAIGGELEGAELEELPVSEKTTWGAWRAAHPDTLVLSIDGVEHVEENPYDGYFASGDTFRGLEIDDDRLPPKEPIFSFRVAGKPYAVAHTTIAGGRLFELAGSWYRLLLHREPGAPIFASTDAWLLDPSAIDVGLPLAELLAWVDGGDHPAALGVEGFDTFWYSWVAVNEGSELLR